MSLQFASGSLRGSPTRTLLMMLAMSIGVAAVVMLTALGEGARRYVIKSVLLAGHQSGDRVAGPHRNRRASAPAC